MLDIYLFFHDQEHLESFPYLQEKKTILLIKYAIMTIVCSIICFFKKSANEEFLLTIISGVVLSNETKS